MKKELERQLVDKYPLLYKMYDTPRRSSAYTRMNDGFACGDGWYQLLDNTSEKLMNVISKLSKEEQEKYFIFQVKEKFGTLRIYFDSLNNDLSESESFIRNIVREAENISSQTCMTCGKNGAKIRSNGRIMFTACDVCLMLS
jgi:hypothetical protein